MKSLVDYILENRIDESKKELTGLAKIIDHGKPEQIYDNIVNLVNSHSNNLIDAKDVDSLESGMLIGYLKGGKDFDKFATIAIVDDEDNEWFILTIQIGKYGNKKEIERVDIKDKIYADYFGNLWDIYYVEHIDDDLLKAMIKTENLIGKLN